MKLEGRVVLITGSGRNIGKATALKFAKEGAMVVLNGLTNQQALLDVAHEIESKGGEALPVMADVSNPDDVERMVDEATKRFGGVDILISNASIRPHGSLLEMTNEEWRKVMAVDLDATFFLTRAVLPGMLEKGKGNIIAISGLAAFGVRDGAIAVAAAKAGLIGMMRGIAREYRLQGIRANTVVPGNMATDRYDQHDYLEGGTPKLLSVMGEDLTDKEVPMGRKGLPAELAAACVYLASDDAGYTTGQTLHVGGGFYME